MINLQKSDAILCLTLFELDMMLKTPPLVIPGVGFFCFGGGVRVRAHLPR